ERHRRGHEPPNCFSVRVPPRPDRSNASLTRNLSPFNYGSGFVSAHPPRALVLFLSRVDNPVSLKGSRSLLLRWFASGDKKNRSEKFRQMDSHRVRVCSALDSGRDAEGKRSQQPGPQERRVVRNHAGVLCNTLPVEVAQLETVAHSVGARELL